MFVQSVPETRGKLVQYVRQIRSSSDCLHHPHLRHMWHIDVGQVVDPLWVISFGPAREPEVVGRTFRKKVNCIWSRSCVNPAECTHTSTQKESRRPTISFAKNWKWLLAQGPPGHRVWSQTTASAPRCSSTGWFRERKALPMRLTNVPSRVGMHFEPATSQPSNKLVEITAKDKQTAMILTAGRVRRFLPLWHCAHVSEQPKSQAN